ncbi:MAG: peptide-methionine (S)-S-oxide reductase MsrA [Bacteroidales bacterium]|nr:peptide-methionine (S)-S-oxide reductase MsrA [Bacteroidales bacterium]
MNKELYLAGGCFWGTEHYLKQIRGVEKTEVGYANGHTENPTYHDVCTGETGFVETVHVVYDTSVLSLKKLTEIYFESIDPTSLNKQGGDCGTQYRTGIYYVDPSDEPILRETFDEKQRGLGGAPMRVELLPLKNFFRAEDYHQDYLQKNPAGYCHLPVTLFEYAKEANP